MSRESLGSGVSDPLFNLALDNGANRSPSNDVQHEHVLAKLTYKIFRYAARASCAAELSLAILATHIRLKLTVIAINLLLLLLAQGSFSSLCAVSIYSFTSSLSITNSLSRSCINFHHISAPSLPHSIRPVHLIHRRYPPARLVQNPC